MRNVDMEVWVVALEGDGPVEAAVDVLGAALEHAGYTPRVSFGMPQENDVGAILLEIPARPEERPRADGYRIRASGVGPAGRPRVTVSAGNPRGLLYGAHALVAKLQEEGRLPEQWERLEEPRFSIREWATHALQGNFHQPLGGCFDRSVEEIEQALYRIIEKAPEYGVNRLQLDGRPGEGIDVQWFVPYRFLPRLYSDRNERSQRARRALLRRVADRAHRFGLDLILWDHELVFPSSLPDAYPEVKGDGFPICFTHHFWDDFLRHKLAEFFDLLPEVDGVNLTFAETTGYGLLDDDGCRCARCREVPLASKLQRVMAAFGEVCRERGKLLEVRTYNQRFEHSGAVKDAFDAAPANVIVMSKYTSHDFRGIHYPQNPMIGAFGSKEQIVEFTLTPECNGFGYLPAHLAPFYAARIASAGEKGVAGFVGRLDYHLQYSHAHFFTEGPPVLTFDTENEANIHTFTRLMWNPDIDVADEWRAWANKRYGEPAAAILMPAFEATAAITQGIFHMLGIYGPAQLDQVTDPDHMVDVIRYNFLTTFQPDDEEIARRTQSLLHPTEGVVREVVREKEEAFRLASACVDRVKAAQAHLPRGEYESLHRRFLILRESCIFWRLIAESWLNMRRAQQAPKEDCKAVVSEMTRALLAFVRQAASMEEAFGYVYPVANAARGIDAYAYAFAVPLRAWGLEWDRWPALEQLWQSAIAAALPGADPHRRRGIVSLEAGIESVAFGERGFFVSFVGIKEPVELPLPWPIGESRLVGGRRYTYEFRPTGDGRIGLEAAELRE